jgi:hypothetical protein
METIDEILHEINTRMTTMYEGRTPRRDEIMAYEIMRLQEAVGVLAREVLCHRMVDEAFRTTCYGGELERSYLATESNPTAKAAIERAKEQG